MCKDIAKNYGAIISSFIGFLGVILLVIHQDYTTSRLIDNQNDITNKTIESLLGTMRQEIHENEKRAYILKIRDIAFDLRNLRMEPEWVNEEEIRLIGRKLYTLPRLDLPFLDERYLYTISLVGYVSSLLSYSKNANDAHFSDDVSEIIDEMRKDLLSRSKLVFLEMQKQGELHIIPRLTLEAIRKDIEFFKQDIPWQSDEETGSTKLKGEYMSNLLLVVKSSGIYLDLMSYAIPDLDLSYQE